MAVCCAAMPMNARRTRPCRTSSPSTKLAVFAATAKQMPCAPMITAVLMPTTSPWEDTSGPPELPGLSAASVWITSSMSRPERARSDRPSAETTPVVTVDSNPSGLPMAITSWPRLSSLELPSAAGGGADHVAVGEHEPVGRHDDARAGAAVTALVTGRDVEPHHRGADALHHVDDGAGIGVEEGLVIRRNGGRAGKIGRGSVEHGAVPGAPLAMPAWPGTVRK